MVKTNKSDWGSQDNIALTLIRFSLPLILSGILQQLYNWADAFIVGNVDGEVALGAIGSTTTVINFYIMVITGFTLGLSILFAHRFGSNDMEAIPKILASFSLVFTIIFVLFSISGIYLAPWLLRLLNTTPETFEMAADYLRIIFIGLPFLAVYNVYSAALRGIGDSRTPFLAILLSSAVNVVLDIIFVADLDLNVSGAAAATVFSQIAMAVFLVLYSARKYAILRFPLRREFLFNKTALLQGARLGLPPMVQSSVTACGNLVLQNFMNSFGTQTVTAITTAYRVDSIALLPIINLGSGISTMTAQSWGAGEKARGKKILIVGSVMMAVVALILTAAIVPAGSSLIAAFGAGPEAVKIGRDFFRSLSSFYLIYGLATSLRSYLEGTGDVVYSSASGILSLAVRIGASYAFVLFFGNMVIAYAEGFSWCALLSLYVFRMVWKRKELAISKTSRQSS